eukprot:CAMPEP_0184692872 /NCGR_PEP_ID=MMETSP0313-20130426/1201_1 /TAXON_ID=2792 /ORGANISM="Porphyridium aerugineum, Strain SAG 1380-2" /LENGTH=48 /DNA_ID= /DNA_START= /DNA_END= /DNA_ORIENTATION=
MIAERKGRRTQYDEDFGLDSSEFFSSLNFVKVGVVIDITERMETNGKN